MIKTFTRVSKKKIVPDDKKKGYFPINCSSLPLSPTVFVSKERHFTDMSSNRKNNNRTLRNRQGDLWVTNKNSHVCLFLPIQKTSFFHFFFKFSRFQPKFKTKIRSFDWCQQTRYFAPNVFQTDEGRVP